MVAVAEYCVKQIDIVVYLLLSAYIWLFLIWSLCMLWSLESKNVFLFFPLMHILFGHNYLYSGLLYWVLLCLLSGTDL